MSHAGRRIASTAAAAAAVALPVAAAGSAYADVLPLAGSLPSVGNLAGTATAATGGLTQAVPVSSIPVVGGLANTASPLSGMPVVGGLTNSLSKSGLPVVSNLPMVSNLAGLNPAAPQGGSAAMPTSTQSVPMQRAQHEATTVAPQAPAPVEHAVPAPQHAVPNMPQRVTTDAQYLTTHYVGKHKR